MQSTATANNICHTDINESTIVTSVPKPLILDNHPEYLAWLQREEIDRAEQLKIVTQIWEAKKHRETKGNHS